MKLIKIFFLLTIIPLAGFAGGVKDGSDLIAAMHKKYNGKWYKTMTFVQKTTTYKPDGTTDVATWYEAMTLPGSLRIDIAPETSGNGMLFINGKIHSFRDGKLVGARDLVHPLMVLGFDVYGQPVEKTVEQVRAMGIDLSVLRNDKWQGRDVYVVGAKAGDLETPQFWVDKKNLYFVRLIETRPRGDKKTVHETLFNKYQKLSGGWVSPEVVFFVDGKRTMLEEYTDIQANVPLSADLFDPAKWAEADRSYFKKK